MPYMTETEVSNLYQIIERLEARLKEAEAIIKPFAYVQIKLESGAGDVSVISFGEHYRRAAAFLAGGDPNKV